MTRMTAFIDEEGRFMIVDGEHDLFVEFALPKEVDDITFMEDTEGRAYEIRRIL